jgi:hypothetical protein
MAGWPGISRRYKRNAAQRFSFSDPGLPATLEPGTKYPGYYCLKWAEDICLQKKRKGKKKVSKTDLNPLRTYLEVAGTG